MAAYCIFECRYNTFPWALYFAIYCPISKPHKPHSFSFSHRWCFLLSLLSYVSLTLSDGLQFLFLEAQCPPQFCIRWDFARAELSGMITLCAIYYIAGSSLLSPPLFSAYTVVSFSIFNFLPSLDFSFQSVVWFVFSLILGWFFKTHF